MGEGPGISTPAYTRGLCPSQGTTEKEPASVHSQGVLQGFVPQGKDKGLTPRTPPYCQQVCRREHLYKTALPWHTPSLPGSIPQTGCRWRLPVASGRVSFLVAPGEHASGSETGGPWPRETRKRCVSSPEPDVPGLRPIHSKPPSSHLRASCLSKGISGPLEQIWVALDRQGHWLSTQEANMACRGGRSRSEGSQTTKHSTVLGSFTCFHHTWHSLCLIYLSCPVG